jgi:hypothetical protein
MKTVLHFCKKIFFIHKIIVNSSFENVNMVARWSCVVMRKLDGKAINFQPLVRSYG